MYVPDYSKPGGHPFQFVSEISYELSLLPATLGGPITFYTGTYVLWLQIQYSKF